MGLLAVKKLQRKRHQDEQIYHGVAMFNGRKFCSKFFTQLFVLISGAFRLSTLMWVLLERSFPPAEKSSIYDWSKVMTSEVEGQGWSRPA